MEAKANQDRGTAKAKKKGKPQSMVLSFITNHVKMMYNRLCIIVMNTS